MTENKFCPFIKGQCKGEQCMAWKKTVEVIFFKRVVFEGCVLMKN